MTEQINKRKFLFPRKQMNDNDERFILFLKYANGGIAACASAVHLLNHKHMFDYAVTDRICLICDDTVEFIPRVEREIVLYFACHCQSINYSSNEL